MARKTKTSDIIIIKRKTLRTLAITIMIIGVITVLIANSQDEGTKAQKSKVIREPAVAGTWYPSSAEEMEAQLNQFYANAQQETLPGELKALVVPHAGYIYSGQVAANGFNLVNENIETVIILAPAHRVPFKGVSTPNATHYKTPLGEIPISEKAFEMLENEQLIVSIPEAHLQEHAIEAELPLLQHKLNDFEIIPLLVGDADPEQLAQVVLKYLDDKTLIVVSTDLSHYYPYGKAVNIDKNCIDAIPALNFEAMEPCEACGKKPALALMHIAQTKGWKGKLIDYKNSGDTAGEKSAVVGYASIAFHEEGISEEAKQILLDIARTTIENHLSGKELPKLTPGEYPESIKKVQGCFVTLNKGEEQALRGCIGHILPQTELYNCVQQNAVSAAVNDRRFQPVQYSELDDIEIEISVLSVPKLVEFSTPPELLDKLTPLKDGVVIEYNGRTSTYLPQVWEQLPIKEDFLSRLCQKQGSPSDCYARQGVKIYSYQAEVFAESK
ncbi:AmmeMemoRadiSam system protein B [Candidatus Woesearchaeota archaeon]|nr:AmmeMemoRadiSam system protein B [Candidatus Woesearchaeota archaeon]